MRRPTVLAGLLLLTCSNFAMADETRAEPGTWWHAWSWDPLVLLSLAMLALLYGRGFVRMSRKAGLRQTVSRWQAASFFGSLVVIFVALLSPLDAISEELSSAHMVQHMLLMIVAAPLMTLGSPTVVLAWGLREWRNGIGSSCYAFAFRLPHAPILWQPLFVWVLFAATLWGWHHPVLYRAALLDPLVHDAQHLCFFVSAYLFWRVCFDPLGSRRLCPAVAVVYLFASSVHASALGVFLALSPRVWFGEYVGRTSAWGFTPLQDQQLAGLIMWMPACLIYPAAAAIVFGVWLNRYEVGGQQS